MESELPRSVRAVAVLAALVAGCASPAGSGSPVPSAPIATSSAPSAQGSAEPTPSISAAFDVGDGRQLYLECVGAGSPTIVIDVGNDDTIHGSWEAVFEPMASAISSRVCAYDRANLGRSDPAPGPRTISDLADDLVTLLHVADVGGPKVFVGGSFGGNIAGVFAAEHPEEVAGIVFVDSIPANDDPTLDPLRINLTDEQYAACCADRSQNGPPAWDSPDNAEHIDYVGGQAAELASVQALPPVPTSVLTAAEQDCERAWPCDAIAASVAALEALWIASNPHGTQVIVESGHVMQRDAPDVIIEETRKIVNAVRVGT